MKSLQAAFFGTLLLLVYLCGLWRGQKNLPVVAPPVFVQRVPAPPVDALSRHRDYLKCRQQQKVCVDRSTWTTEETELFVREAIGKLGGVIVGESP